ncbi:sigma factor-like helix-turn-helix DNA-binding protein [Bacillus thuringiensis]|uniref:sigma factor-like helix-turn-helix DNA-binding protein n=1 Tax=Bacillus thuringiensis TaxID=1428 RepID=UPI0026E12C35|nr:sigma factor-like helix-turn-helix DNA-binding protein [Bacillus thuringiensis]MDO6631780.1 sigma factor-like helix-turn-helix DNA-binding protein [Bacillus thuringiensis]MDO6661389.1 sigma factor-like helix-turn-helix DNA-binding protein [Bacillus thuringiensis]MDO6701920.1 sigma factor-like helix-turn-helix DNA-binding protein [Bacillus thuringiensis]
MFDWLKDYQKLKEDIAYLEYNLDKTKGELRRWISGDLQDVRLTAESDGAKVEERIEAIEYELAYKMNDVFDLKKLIHKFEGLDHQILTLKYMDGLTLEEVAERVDYSYSHVKKRHAELIRLIRFVEKKGIIKVHS